MSPKRLSFVAAAVLCAVAAFYLGLGALLVRATAAVLVLFVAVLYGIFLRHTGGWISRLTGLSPKAGVAISTTLQLLLAAGVLAFAAGRISEQVQQAVSQIDEAKASATEQLDRIPWLKRAVAADPTFSRLLLSESPTGRGDRERSSGDEQRSGSSDTDQSSASTATDDTTSEQASAGAKDSEPSAKDDPGGPLSQGPTSRLADEAKSLTASVVTTAFGAVANLLVIFFVGLYLALDPALYRRGVLKLLPPHARRRGGDVFGRLDETLWRWLLGRFATMLLTGVGVGLTLWAIGTPMPATLGVITGLLTFVPNIGPIIACALAVLVALPKGMTVAGLTVAGYVGFQLIESYVLTPIIQKRQVAMPPALILVAQLLLGVVAGFMGVAVATPLVAAAMVLVSLLYIEDVLGEAATLEDLPGIDSPVAASQAHSGERMSDAAAGSEDDRNDAEAYRRWQREHASAEPTPV